MLFSLFLVGPSVLIISAADPPDPELQLIGKGEISGDAIDGAAAHIDDQPPQLPELLFSPGQLKKILPTVGL